MTTEPERPPSPDPWEEIARLRAELERLRARKEREDLLRTISHDLRTPLSALLLQAQLMQRVLPAEDPNRPRVARIVANGQRLAGMISDLLDIARLESGRLPLQCRSLDLGEFFTELRERLAGTLEMERVRVRSEPRLPRVAADPERLERVFCNLIGSALKYAPAGSEVVVSCAAEPGRVRVTVSDSGPGIEADELPHLFQRDFRTRQAQGTEGLGLGLYASALIVRAHGGTIEAESEPGRGSLFHVRLPLAR